MLNKKLIKKYKAEFDYWLNGGLVYGYSEVIKDWYKLDTIWENKNKMNLIIIMDDEYVEFRKALAEGKEIQLKNACGYDSNFKKDEWMKVDKICIHIPLQFYRIASKDNFKIGEWVENINPKQWFIREIFKYSESNKNDQIKKWVPEEGEMCMHQNEDSENFIIKQYQSEFDILWYTIEPIIFDLNIYKKDK